MSPAYHSARPVAVSHAVARFLYIAGTDRSLRHLLWHGLVPLCPSPSGPVESQGRVLEMGVSTYSDGRWGLLRKYAHPGQAESCQDVTPGGSTFHPHCGKWGLNFQLDTLEGVLSPICCAV